MIVNSEQMELEQPISLHQLLSKLGYAPEKIAVERNGRIIPKAEYADAMVTNEDTLEIVSFVGGG